MQNSRKHGGNLREIAQKYNIALEDIVDLSANINPFGPPQKVFEKIKDNLELVKNYPDPDCKELVDAISTYLNIDKNRIVVGNGASEIIFLLMHLFKPKNIFLPAPSFSEYEHASLAIGANINYIRLIDGYERFDLSEMDSMQKGDCLFLCNPNNPTGVTYSRDFIIKVLKKAKDKGGYLILDESFVDFIREDITFKSYLDEFSNLVILYSLTKFFSIPGIRLGVALASEQIIDGIKSIKDPWNVNVFAQAIGQDLLNDVEFIENTKRFYENERKYIYDEMKEVKGLKVYKPSANFIFFEITNEYNIFDVQEKLLEYNIIVRDCSNYKFLNEKFFRVAIKTEENNRLFVEAIKEMFK